MAKNEQIYSEGLSMISIALIIILLVSIVFSGLQYFNKKSLSAEKTEKETTLTQMKEDITSKEDQKFANLAKANEVKTRFDNEIKWSKVIQNITKITPKDVFFKSYSGSSSSKVLLAGTAKEIKNIQDLIDIFVQKEYLSEVFVPNIVRGEKDGAKEYSFSVELDYKTVTQ